jgi:ubiquinone/menaquinone biosynthesis C-methylase UbiE
LSGFYKLEWIKNNDDNISIININAGFDETSELLKMKFVNSNFTALDFYNPNKHTEVSIKRARKQYPPYPNTKEIETSKIDLESNSIDKVFVILSAHEIRNKTERIIFFSELNRILKPKGQIIVIEHLRDISNFIAYNIGSFHFHSKSSWLNTFNKSKLRVISEIKNTPFISTFTLEKNGITL